jgi:hypothetical protein
MNEQECKAAAADMGYSFHGTGSWDADYPNCQGDETGSIWFNTDQNTQGTWGPSTYGQWCKRTANAGATCSRGVTGN